LKQEIKIEGGGYDQLGAWHIGFSTERQKKYQRFLVDEKKRMEMLDRHQKVMNHLATDNKVFVGREFFPGKLKDEDFVSIKQYAEYGGDINIIYRKLVFFFKFQFIVYAKKKGMELNEGDFSAQNGVCFETIFFAVTVYHVYYYRFPHRQLVHLHPACCLHGLPARRQFGLLVKLEINQ
jgi:hypothetical protein